MRGPPPAGDHAEHGIVDFILTKRCILVGKTGDTLPSCHHTEAREQRDGQQIQSPIHPDRPPGGRSEIGRLQAQRFQTREKGALASQGGRGPVAQQAYFGRSLPAESDGECRVRATAHRSRQSHAGPDRRGHRRQQECRFRYRRSCRELVGMAGTCDFQWSRSTEDRSADGAVVDRARGPGSGRPR
jgi:hypothetical protein